MSYSRYVLETCCSRFCCFNYNVAVNCTTVKVFSKFNIMNKYVVIWYENAFLTVFLLLDIIFVRRNFKHRQRFLEMDVSIVNLRSYKTLDCTSLFYSVIYTKYRRSIFCNFSAF